MKKSNAKILRHLAPKWKLPSLKNRESLKRWKQDLHKSRQGRSVRPSCKQKGSLSRSRSARKSLRLRNASEKFSSKSRESLMKRENAWQKNEKKKLSARNELKKSARYSRKKSAKSERGKKKSARRKTPARLKRLRRRSLTRARHWVAMPVAEW